MAYTDEYGFVVEYDEDSGYLMITDGVGSGTEAEAFGRDDFIFEVSSYIRWMAGAIATQMADDLELEEVEEEDYDE